MTVIGTRPEIIRLSRVMACLESHLDHVMVHTGQNYDYELNEIFFRDFAIKKPGYFLDAAKKTAAETIGRIIIKIDPVLEKEKPDALLVLGDTNSCLAAIPAKRRKVPIFHMEAGNRCFDLRVPEEINRKIVDHISDINLTYSEHSRRYLLMEGVKPETVIKTGSPMKEVLDYYMPKIEESDVHKRLNLKPSEYFIVSAHREENIDCEENFGNFLEALNAIAEKFGRPVIVSTHPRTRLKMEKYKDFESNSLISFLKPLGFFDYVKLQMNSFCVVSDSGTITEESSILNFPAVTIRNAHERPEGMDEGTLIMCGLNPERVIESISIVAACHKKETRRFKLVKDYDVDNVSTKVLRIILSYTDYVNRTVWRK